QARRRARSRCRRSASGSGTTAPPACRLRPFRSLAASAGQRALDPRDERALELLGAGAVGDIVLLVLVLLDGVDLPPGIADPVVDVVLAVGGHHRLGLVIPLGGRQ